MRFQVQIKKFGINLVSDGKSNLFIERIVDDFGIYYIYFSGGFVVHVKIDRNTRRNYDLYYL